MKNFLSILLVFCLISCHFGQKNDNINSSVPEITVSENKTSQVLNLTADREISFDNYCYETTQINGENNLDVIKLSPYFYIDSIFNLEKIDTLNAGKHLKTTIKFSLNKVKPLHSNDSASLGDCTFIIGEFISNIPSVRYLVFSDYSEGEYRTTIKVFSINDKHQILDIGDFAEISGDGGDSYNTFIRQISPRQFEYTMIETHLADNGKMDTIASYTKTGLIELKENGKITRTK